MQCVPTAAADKTWRKWGLDRVPVVVKLCSFLSSFRWFIHSLLLPFFFACEHRSMQEAFHAVFYSICEGHTHTHTHTQRVFVFSTLSNQKRQTSLITAGLKLLFTGASGPDFLLISVLSFFWGTVWFQQITSLSGYEQLISLWLSVLLQLLSSSLKRTTVSGYNARLEQINIS